LTATHQPEAAGRVSVFRAATMMKAVCSRVSFAALRVRPQPRLPPLRFPIDNPLRSAERNISLSCSSRPRRAQRCSATEPFDLGPTSILLPRPIERLSTSISRRQTSRSQPHDQQRRFYNYHPGGNRERSSPPYDPEQREARLREAKPLIRTFKPLSGPGPAYRFWLNRSCFENPNTSA